MGLLACGDVGSKVVRNSFPDGDPSRDNARLVPMSRVVTDNISATKGDHTDWKYTVVDEPGQLNVQYGIDAPKSAKGEIIIYDGLGAALSRRKLLSTVSIYNFGVDAEPGRYYMKFDLTAGSTVYSVSTSVEQQAPTDPCANVDCPANHICEAGLCKQLAKENPCANVDCKSGFRCSRKSGKCFKIKKARVNPCDKCTSSERCVDKKCLPISTGKTVNGSIVRVIPANAGKPTLITLQLGANHGVTAGIRGKISGGGSFKVIRAFKTRVQATTSTSPSKLREKQKITIRIP
jgi:hypothetical protein